MNNENLIPKIGVITDIRRDTPDVKTFRVVGTDGKKLFGSKDRENCFVDGCHPNDLGFYRMAKMLYKPLKEAIKDYKI